MKYAEKVGANITLGDIDRSHRVGNRDNQNARAIIVKFTSYRARQRMYLNRRADRDIFMSEDLTKKRSQIMFKARALRRSGKIKSCDTKDGRMFVRENGAWGSIEGGATVQIFEASDLDKYATGHQPMDAVRHSSPVQIAHDGTRV